MTIRMVASLRMFGGSFAHAPVLAVNPRRGVPLARRTREILDQHGVRVVHETRANTRPWFSFFNKIAALSVAERLAETETIGWLDSDILLLAEPRLLNLEPDEDFVACPSDSCGASTGPDDKNDAYWNLIVSLAGLRIEDYPWLTNCQGARIRTYFNSGVFVYRRGRGFFEHYQPLCERLLMSGYKSPLTGVFFTDQVSLGVAAIAAGLRIRALPLEYNYPVGDCTEQPYCSERMARSVLMHYHGALCPGYWDTMLGQLRQDRPAVGDWLEPWGPITGKAPLPSRLLRKALKEFRRRRCERFVEKCREIHAGMAIEPTVAAIH